MREVAGTERATVLFCLEERISHAMPTHCEVDVPFTETSNHRYRFDTGASVECHGNVPHTELTGTFSSEIALGTTGEGQAEQHVELTTSK